MRSFRARALALIIAAGTLLAATDPEPEDEDDGSRIVGGRVAPADSAPWQAEIFNTSAYTASELQADQALPASDPNKLFLVERGRSDRNHRCGGAYIGNDWVVTAAHCLYRSANGRQVLDAGYLTRRQVRLGTQTISSGGQVHAIRFGLVHGGYAGAESPEHDNDIALLKLVHAPASTSGRINLAAIDLPAATYAPQTNAPLLVTGWGMTVAQESGLRGNLSVRPSANSANFNPASNALKELSLYAVSLANCAQSYGMAPGKLAHSICALARPDAQNRLQDQCSGDSGGPLTRSWRGPTGLQHQLVGLVSWSKGCAQRNGAGQQYPGVFVAVAPYAGWIAATQRWADGQGSALDGKMQRYSAEGGGNR